MSYILDALRKAERDRHLAHVPTLATIHTPAAARPARRWPWVLAAALALSIGAVVVVAFREERPDVYPLPSGSPEQRRSTTPTVVARPSPPAADTRAASRAGAVADKPRDEPARVAAVRSAPSERAPATPGGETARPAATASTSTEAKQAPRVSIVAPDKPASPPSPVPGGSAPSPVSGRPRSLQEMPASVRESLPAMKLEVLYYSDTAAERMVFINGRKYVEGQTVDGKAVVEEIARDGAVLSYQGQRFLLRQ